MLSGNVVTQNTSAVLGAQLASQVSFVSAEEMSSAMELVSKLDFTQMNNKLVSFYEWSAEMVALMDNYYKKWLAIHACYPELATAPNEVLDNYWHMHILDTKKYMNDCQEVFGQYFHHYPYFGLEGDSSDLNDAFNLTNQLFEHHFGHTLTGKANPCKSTACR